jgi:hypothetical protein
MIKLIREGTSAPQAKTKFMNDMKPLEVCVVADRKTLGGEYDGHVVMRTAADWHFEVIDITDPHPSAAWTTTECRIKVRELYPGEKYLLELS